MSDRVDPGAEISDEALDAAVAEVPAPVPPPDFADRVLAARAVESPATDPRRRLGWVVAGFAVAAAMGMVVWRGLAPGAVPGAGQVRASDRESVRLAARGIAVAEPAAALSWRVDDVGGAVVDQTRGRVFYRVEPGGPFVVRTPAGEVRASGTCFTVKIEGAVAMSNAKATLKGAALGAAVTAAVFVTVHEGGVVLANAHGDRPVLAGERGRLMAERAPELVLDERRVAPPPLPPLDAPRTPVAPSASGDVARPLVSPEEIVALREEVGRLKGRLADERAMRAESEGTPVKAPADLPEAFTEPALAEAFRRALDEAGLEGEIRDVDCSEYPCIVYGDVANEDDQALDKMEATDALSAYRDDVSRSVSAWGNKQMLPGGLEDRRTFFGIAYFPEAHEPARREAIGRRLRFRNQQAAEALREP